MPTRVGRSAGGPFRPSLVEYIQPPHPWRFDRTPAHKLADYRRGHWHAITVHCLSAPHPACKRAPQLRRDLLCLVSRLPQAVDFLARDQPLMRDRPLEVPIYQRSYAWTKEQVEQFWDDLRAAMAVPNPEYFMGTFVLTGGTDSRATIIDGQQRLGTTALLLACFRDYLAEVKDTNRAATIETDYLASRDLRSGQIETRLLMNRDDREFFAQFLTSESTPISPHTESNLRILEAYEFLRSKVREEIRTAGPNWTNRLFQWVDFLESRVQVIVVRVNNDADAFLIFETLNDRGLALTIADLLKNYLFGLAGGLIDELEASWVRMIASFDAPADEEVVTTFLRHYWSSFHGATEERDLYRRIRADIRSQNQAFDLIADLEISSTNYAAL